MNRLQNYLLSSLFVVFGAGSALAGDFGLSIVYDDGAPDIECYRTSRTYYYNTAPIVYGCDEPRVVYRSCAPDYVYYDTPRYYRSTRVYRDCSPTVRYRTYEPRYYDRGYNYRDRGHDRGHDDRRRGRSFGGSLHIRRR